MLYHCDVITNVIAKTVKNKLISIMDKRQRKSEKLTPDVKRALAKFVNDQETQTDAAEKIGISRNTLVLIKAKGSCHPETASKIREALSLN